MTTTSRTGLLARITLAAALALALAPAPAGADPGTTRTFLSDLPSGHRPTVARVVGTTIVTPQAKVRLHLPEPYTDPVLLGRRGGQWIVQAYGGDLRFPEQLAIFGVTARATTRLLIYTNARELYTPYLVPGSDRVLMISDGADSYNPFSYQDSLFHGVPRARSFTTSAERSPVLAVDRAGALLEVGGRIVRWDLRGRKRAVLDGDASPEGLTPVVVLGDQDLVGYTDADADADADADGTVSWRRLSDPDAVVWTSGPIADDPLHDPLALSPDGRRLVTWEETGLVVRRTSDGHVLSTVDLWDDARNRRAELGRAVWEDDGSFLVEVQRGRYKPGHEGVVRCTVRGRCSYALAPTVDASLTRS